MAYFPQLNIKLKPQMATISSTEFKISLSGYPDTRRYKFIAWLVKSNVVIKALILKNTLLPLFHHLPAYTDSTFHNFCLCFTTYLHIPTAFFVSCGCLYHQSDFSSQKDHAHEHLYPLGNGTHTVRTHAVELPASCDRALRGTNKGVGLAPGDRTYGYSSETQMFVI